MYTGAMVDDALGAGGLVVSNAGLLLPEEINAINHESKGFALWIPRWRQRQQQLAR